jgi:translation elongation factor EF-Tu-like GTPase
MNYIKTMACIELLVGEKMRKMPFSNGYRPLFDFEGADTKISGRIDLINREVFSPGMVEDVQITFIRGIISDNCFATGTKFTFNEGSDILGKGEIRAVINTNTPPYIEA